MKHILFGFIAKRGEPALDVMGAMDEGWLLERINDYLQDKKYLLVMIYGMITYGKSLNMHFREKGRIIITTRLRGYSISS